MDMTWVTRSLFTYEGGVYTLIFALIFTLTNLVMIDFSGLQTDVTGQEPFFILMLVAILVYQYKNSYIAFSRVRIIFLSLWLLYVLSMGISMVAADHFVWKEAVILMLITLIFCFRMPKSLVRYLVLGSLLSLPALLLADHTLNESGATLIFAFTAGLMLVPKSNRAMIFYMLSMFAALLLITTSRTAILSYFIILILQLSYINLYQRFARHRQRFIKGLLAATLIPLVVFIRPIYRFFTTGAISTGGIDWNALTSGRSELWAAVWRDRQWFGGGHSYFDFSQLPHAHNIFFDTLGRYGIITAVFFVLLLAGLFLLSVVSINTVHIAMYMFIFIVIGMFEYSYLFMFTYVLPPVLFFALANAVVTYHEQSDHMIKAQGR